MSLQHSTSRPALFDWQDIKVLKLIWGCSVLLSVIGLMVPALRYAAYLCPAFLLLALMTGERITVPRAALPFAMLVAVGSLLLIRGSDSGGKDLYFIFCGIAIFLVIGTVEVPVKFLLALFAFGTVLDGFRLGNLAGGFQFDFSNSVSSFESSFGFLFGLLFVYAIATGRWAIAAMAMIGSILALKRIVLLAEAVCMLVMIFPERWRKWLLSPAVMLIVNSLFVVVIALYATNNLDTLISQKTGQSSNQLGMGRQELYSRVVDNILESPEKTLAIGAGPGAAYAMISGDEGHANLHSDVLKLVYEYGAIVTAAFFWIAYSGNSWRRKLMFLFANILFVSDNVLIYQFFLFFFIWLSNSVSLSDAVADTKLSVPRKAA